MNESVNILLLSCGTRNKIVQYFKKELAGRGLVIATDCSELAPALYDADRHYIVPRIDDEGYLDQIITICKENNVKAILSLIDPELTLLAKYKQDFLDIDVIPIVSDIKAVELAFDKYEMYKYLEQNGYNTPKSYIDKEKFYQDVSAGEVNYPVFVKPIRGSASLNISKVQSQDEIELLFKSHEHLMIQEFMDAAEYGIDVYIDLITNEPVSLFAKEKIKMRAGETDKSVSIKDDKLTELILRFVKDAGFKGIIDIDVFKRDDEYYISEVNPRFGGGYPHAYECGVNIPQMILNNIYGNENIEVIGQYEEGISMMKFSDVMITRLYSGVLQ